MHGLERVVPFSGHEVVQALFKAYPDRMPKYITAIGMTGDAIPYVRGYDS